MNKIRLENLKSGMVFTGDVKLLDDSVFLPAFTVLNEHDISKLKRNFTEELKYYGSIVYDGLGDILSKQLQFSFWLYKDDLFFKKNSYSILSKLMQLYKNSSDGETPYDDFLKLKNNILINIQEENIWIYFKILTISNNVKTFPSQILMSFIIAYLISKKLKYSLKETNDLLISCLIIYLGITIDKEFMLNKVKKDLFSDSTIHSKTLKLLNQENFSPSVVHIIENFYDCFDKSKIEKDSSIISSQILHLAFYYSTLTLKSSVSDGINPHQSLKKILEKNNLFKEDILKSFIEELGIYPVGSLVFLDDLSLAVVEEPTDKILSPKVIVLISAEGIENDTNVNPLKINLSKDSSRKILKIASTKDLILNNLHN